MIRSLAIVVCVMLAVAATTLSAAGATVRRAAAPTADDGARVVAESRITSRMIDLTIESPAMAGREKVRLLTPRGWSKDAGRTWPVLWLLHGGSDDYRSWSDKTTVEEMTADLDVLVVMPNGGKCGNYSDWWNYGNGGPPAWETFHTTEIRQILERGYRAGTSRAIAGLSMGGLGTMKYAARHPGMFKAAAAFSGYLHTLHGHSRGQEWTGWGPALVCPGTDWRRVWGHPDDQADVWHAHNPYHLAHRLRGVQLRVTSGNGTRGSLGGSFLHDFIEAGTYDMSRAFVSRLQANGIPVTTRWYDGQHRWQYWDRELRLALPWLMNAIG